MFYLSKIKNNHSKHSKTNNYQFSRIIFKYRLRINDKNGFAVCDQRVQRKMWTEKGKENKKFVGERER